MNGVITVYKEQDYTSFDVVAIMRGILHEKKIGHGGTLDPKAEGVLPVFIGSATKLCDFLPYDDKCYEAELTLGLETDTEDIWGVPVSEKEVNVTEEEVREAVGSFLGGYEQIPPMYSAKKLNGKKLYELARKGEIVERKPEYVEIRSIRIDAVELPKVRFTVACSKGTYIRTLCADIGRKLGTGGCMSALKRVRHGIFTAESAYRISEIEEAVKNGKTEEILRPVESLFPEDPALYLKPEFDAALQNGNKLKPEMIEKIEEGTDSGRFRVYASDGSFRAVYGYDAAEAVYKPLKMFLN